MRALAMLVLVGCGPHPGAGPGDAGSDGPGVCGLGFLGDPSTPVQLDLIALGADGASSPIGEGSAVALLFPPQGGRVVFAGVRASNIDPCGVELSGALRDPASNEVRVDVRTVNLGEVDGGAGASTDSNISSFANIPVCPNEWSSQDAYGNPYALTVSVKDREGRTASQTIHVTPVCAEPARLSECLCICKAGYVLGQACPSDGGVE
jgi:hypothetical protein